MRSTIQWTLLLTALLVFNVAQAMDLSDFDGHKRNISDYSGKGKWLVVMFWAHDCHVCNQEAGSYVKFHQQHKDKDATILGVSVDGKQYRKQADAFITRHKLNFPNLIGEPEHVIGMYAQLTGESRFGTPTFLIYSPKGDLVAQQVGAVPTHLIETFIKQESASSSVR